METRPSDFEFIPNNVMSNSDHVINREVEAELRKGGCYAYYPAWNFHAEVWFDGIIFKCMLRRFHKHVETIKGTLEEIMEEASDTYGYN